jgi:hypothetical protein
MKKDLIIGGASNYTWDQLKYWVNSIKRSGFTGDIVLCATNMTKATIDKLQSKGVILELYGKMQEDGSIKANSNGAPHVERFFYMWNWLNQNGDNYDYVIATDTRDVVFQTNPSTWIEENLMLERYTMISSSEGLRYEDEPWGNTNLLQAFGPYFHNLYKSAVINNVGVIAGESLYVRDMFFMIFQMSINRPIPIVDQAVYNVLLQQKPFKNIMKQTYNSDAWAIQLGTTLEAVKSGFGDIGQSVLQDPRNLDSYMTKYFDFQPQVDDEGYVVSDNKTKYVIVHQYDRTPAWKNKIMEKYND